MDNSKEQLAERRENLAEKEMEVQPEKPGDPVPLNVAFGNKKLLDWENDSDAQSNDVDVDQDQQDELQYEVSVEEIDDALILATIIRDNSVVVKLTYEKDLREFMGLEEEVFQEKLAELFEKDEYVDINRVRHEEDVIYYSNKHISNTYADLLIRLEKGDLLELIAHTVRHESKIYPRPTTAEVFLGSPYNFTKKQLPELLKKLYENEAYQDIQEVRASNDALYLYSTLHITATYAQSLAEWIEVEQDEHQ